MLLFYSEFPSFLHHVISQQSLQQIRHLPGLLKVQSTINFALNVLGYHLQLLDKLMLTLNLSFKHSIKLCHLLDLRDDFLKALIVPDLPIVLFPECLESSLGI